MGIVKYRGKSYNGESLDILDSCIVLRSYSGNILGQIQLGGDAHSRFKIIGGVHCKFIHAGNCLTFNGSINTAKVVNCATCNCSIEHLHGDYDSSRDPKDLLKEEQSSYESLAKRLNAKRRNIVELSGSFWGINIPIVGDLRNNGCSRSFEIDLRGSVNDLLVDNCLSVWEGSIKSLYVGNKCYCDLCKIKHIGR